MGSPITYLRDRPLNIPLVLDSTLPSFLCATEGRLEESAEENVGGDMISWVCVSLLMNVNSGASKEGSRGAAGGGACASVSFSFFLRISLKGILNILLRRISYCILLGVGSVAQRDVKYKE